MKHLKTFEELNESMLLTILLSGAAIWCIWKFLKGWAKSYVENHPEKFPEKEEKVDKVKELLGFLDRIKKDHGTINVKLDKEWIILYIEGKKLLINKKEKMLNWPGLEQIPVTQNFINQLEKEIESDVERYKKVQ